MENTHKKDKPCEVFNKTVDNPHFWNLFSTFSHEAQLPHFAAVHSKSLFLVPTNRESKSFFIT